MSVEWVVITAGLMGLALATFAVTSGGVEDLSGELQTDMADYEIGPEAVFGPAPSADPAPAPGPAPAPAPAPVTD